MDLQGHGDQDANGGLHRADRLPGEHERCDGHGGKLSEYTVLGEKVVYLVVGRRTVEFIPLAEDMDFLVRKNEIVIFSQDEKSKSRFVIQQMTLRADWEREEKRKELVEKALERSVNYEVRNPPRVAAVSASAQ